MKNGKLEVTRRSAMAAFGAGIALPTVAGCMTAGATAPPPALIGFDPKGKHWGIC